MKTSVQQPPPSKPRAVPTTNKTSAPKQKRFVSAANVFKQRAPKTTTALHPNLQAHGSAVHKANTHLQADTESPTKLFSEESDSSKHPLAVAFNEATTNYRTTLYETTVSQINDTHSSLIAELDKLKSLPVPIGNREPTAAVDEGRTANEPLSRTEYLHGLIDSIYKPIGTAGLLIPKKRSAEETDNDQEPQHVEMELGHRLSQFEAHIDQDEKAISMLQTQWERVMSEIWRCGVQILGEESMARFLETQIEGADARPTSAAATSPLFIPEHEDAGHAKRGKRVQFKEHEYHELPEFIRHANRKGEALPALPDVPRQEVEALKKQIEKLGAAQVEEMKRLNKEQDEWYRKKTKQLLSVWQADV